MVQRAAAIDRAADGLKETDMRALRYGMIGLVLAPALLSAPVEAKGVPGLQRVGQCAMTKVKTVGTRLVDGPTNKPVVGSGSSVELANGVYGVSYDQVPAVDKSRVGDPIRVCLVQIPKNCPKGDDRGRFYKATNLRTKAVWTLPDAEHMCGGA
jgi:hypothetical protein